MSSELIAAVDVGSSRVKAMIATFNETGSLRVLGVGTVPSHGVRRGAIMDMEEFKKDVDAALSEAEKMTGTGPMGAVTIGVSGSHIECFQGSGSITIPSSEVHEEDIHRALDLSVTGMDLTNREILKIIPQSYIINMSDEIKNPIGMSAKNLESRTHIIVGSQNTLSNVRKGVGSVGIDVLDTMPNLITAPEAILTSRQKELGVVVLDIGHATTNMTVYEDGVLMYAGIIPMGGEHVTSDLAIGARVSIDVAERLKLEYASVGDLSEEEAQMEIDLAKISKTEDQTIFASYVAEIVRARYEEILQHAFNNLRNIGRDGMLPEGVVLLGGGAKMKGLIELTKNRLRLPVMIGVPKSEEYIAGTSIADPAYAALIGTVILSRRFARQAPKRLQWNMGDMFGGVKNFISKLLP